MLLKVYDDFTKSNPNNGYFVYFKTGRTTLIIAHRLSTIRHADKIIVMQDGHVAEEGDHELLIKSQGLYFDFVKQQNLRQIEEDEELKLEQKEMKESMFDEVVIQPITSSYEEQKSLEVYDIKAINDENITQAKVIKLNAR